MNSIRVHVFCYTYSLTSTSTYGVVLVLVHLQVVNVVQDPVSKGFMSNREAQRLGKGPGLYYCLEGRSNFRFGTEQKVILKQKPL